MPLLYVTLWIEGYKIVAGTKLIEKVCIYKNGVEVVDGGFYVVGDGTDGFDGTMLG